MMFGNIEFEKQITTCLKCLDIITQASATKESLCQEGSQHLIENVLQQNLVSLASWLKNEKALLLESAELAPLRKTFLEIEHAPSKVTIRSSFSSVCVTLLSHLTSLLNDDVQKEATSDLQSCESKDNLGSKTENTCPVLSIQQGKQISSCIQFVVVLGLCPYLPQGIGIPVSERLGPGQILLATSHDTVTSVSEAERLQSLLPVLELLVRMMKCVHLRGLITEKYLSDILVLLIQARHSAKNVLQDLKNKCQTELKIEQTIGAMNLNKEPSAEVIRDTCERDANDVAPEGEDESLSVERIQQVVHDCNVELDRSIRLTNASLVLREVLCLLGFVKSGQGAKSVPWFRRVVAGILRDMIMHPPGVQQLLTAFLGDMSSYDTKDWQNCKAVARIISHCPVNVKNVEQFFSSVSQQLLGLIHPKESSVPLAITKAVGAALVELDNLQSKLMTQVCFSHLTAPLANCSINGVNLTSKTPDSTIVSEKELTDCISHCHRLFAVGQETQSSLLVRLEPVLGVLFSLYVQVRQSASHLRGFVRDLLACYLSYLDTKDAVSCLLELLVPSSKTTCPFPPVHPDVAFVTGDDGGLQAVIAKEKRESIESWTDPANAVVDLLKSSKSDDLNSSLFIALLQRLTNVVKAETSSGCQDILMPARALSPDVKAASLKELKEKIAMVSLISAAGEEFGSSIIQSTSQIVAFTKATLDRCVAMCATSSDTDTRMFEWETLTMSLGLLSAVLGIGCLFTDEDKRVMDSIVPLLSSLSQSEAVQPHIRDMAKDLKVSVATRGLVSVNLSDQTGSSPTTPTAESKKEVTEKALSKPLIEVISSKDSCSKSQAVDSIESNLRSSFNEDLQGKSSSQTSGTDSRDEWSVAMAEVDDPQIPIKGHGLIQLAKMVEERREGVVTHSDALLKVFLDNLNNADSYIYLASVNGLAALSDLCHKEVIPSLTSEFRLKSNDAQCSWETIVKVGEAIVKATRRLGEIAPTYRDVLLSAILCGCHHGNSLVRASCLSCLADICKLLRYSISPVIQEVLLCCGSVLRSDPEFDPRRAAVLTLTSLLQGLGKDVMTVLGEDMKELYRSLKYAVQMDPDEKVKVHAHLALGELDEIMKGFLFPSQDLKKSIQILGYQ